MELVSKNIRRMESEFDVVPLSDADSTADTEDERITTLMLCNLPCRMRHQELSEILDGLGFHRRYDFLRIIAGGQGGPKAKSNLGYGFVNFYTAADAKAFTCAFEGFKFVGTDSKKLGTARPAEVQGFLATMDMCRPKDPNQGARGHFTFTL
mmetsp:Transcript_14664/g.43843  ORF Transcript_14664/g.43843 Transcript_14664/m.43843 type:complete len:152 (-) Transcript_14664:34-489(-)